MQSALAASRPTPPSCLMAAATLALACSLSAVPAAAEEAGFGAPIALGDSVEILGDEADRLYFGAGAFNVIPNDDEKTVRNDSTSFEARGAYRFGRKLYGIGPLVGLMVNSDGGVYGYGGLYADVAFGNWVITPSGGFGGYAANDSKYLSGTFQFQLSLEGAYEFEDGSRVGLRMSHISNAGMHDDNEGVESALVTYSYPLRY